MMCFISPKVEVHLIVGSVFGREEFFFVILFIHKRTRNAYGSCIILYNFILLLSFSNSSSFIWFPVGRKSDSCTHVAGFKLGIDPIPMPDSVVRNVSPNKIAAPTTPGAVRQAQSASAETDEESSENSPNETNNSHQKNGGKHRKDAYKQTQVQFRYSPKTSSEELKEICRMSKSSLIPLFEKELTASDADIRNGRLVLPKRCAEAFFPKISGQQGTFLVVQDTKGNNWELYYRYWSNSNGKMYVLEGLKDYILLMQWQAGDTVTFYKREADGKLLMGFKKYEAAKSVHKSST